MTPGTADHGISSTSRFGNLRTSTFFFPHQPSRHPTHVLSPLTCNVLAMEYMPGQHIFSCNGVCTFSFESHPRLFSPSELHLQLAFILPHKALANSIHHRDSKQPAAPPLQSISLGQSSPFFPDAPRPARPATIDSPRSCSADVDVSAPTFLT